MQVLRNGLPLQDKKRMICRRGAHIQMKKNRGVVDLMTVPEVRVQGVNTHGQDRKDLALSDPEGVQLKRRRKDLITRRRKMKDPNRGTQKRARGAKTYEADSRGALLGHCLGSPGLDQNDPRRRKKRIAEVIGLEVTGLAASVLNHLRCAI